MIVYPNAKINLGLNVIRKRDDVYHDIESVFVPVPWRDILEVNSEKAGKGKVSFSSSGIQIPSNGEPNLCERVYALMHEEFSLPSVKIHLHKIVPMGAGLGGGSADAAFTATVIDQLFDLGLSAEKLELIVSKVGSDCPFFIQNQPAYVTGRGEKLESFELDLKGYWMVLVNPNIHIGTKEAYAGIRPQEASLDLRELLKQPIQNWKGRLKNDFEDSVFPNYPVLFELKQRLYLQGAVYASMTGSGSTVFGLFETEPKWNSKDGFQVKIVNL